MYCKNCGKEIAEDSRFCKYCGVEQDNITTNTSESYNSSRKVIEIPTIKTNFSNSTKWWIIGYGLWFVLNLYWLFAGDKHEMASQLFQPFAKFYDVYFYTFDSYSFYDITEFIVYVIGLPLFVWGVIMLVNKFQNNRLKD